MAPLMQAWGGELPVFGSAEEMDEVMNVLMYGLWNRLSEHQSSRKPFKLTRFEVTASRQALHGLAEMRAQELKAFVDGLLGPDDEMVLPQKAHDAVVALAQLYEMFVGATELLADSAQPAPDQELKALLQNFQRMTILADEQINKAVQSCKRARLSSGQHAEKMAATMSKKVASAAAPFDDMPGTSEGDAESEPDFTNSPLSQTVTRNGVTVDVEIYGDGHGGWILEIVDAENASHVWDEPFETEQQALTEAFRALDAEPLEFLGRAADQPLN
ncbi:hypothetical protein [Roseateles albus]|uniref:DUF1631 family protein n=1 Tax=Roseateles albus TaxID=2987525 RepID=A0ABT5KHN9_9BURK|nr:hypothetical protein [Roseateles albus]MDC8773443.1 hypothetical protein [Roseateles albus]